MTFTPRAWLWIMCVLSLAACGRSLSRKDNVSGGGLPNGARGMNQFADGFPLTPAENPLGQLSLDPVTKVLSFLPTAGSREGQFVSQSFEMPSLALVGFAVLPEKPYGMELPPNGATELFPSESVSMTGNKAYYRFNETAPGVYEDHSGGQLTGSCSLCPVPAPGVFRSGQRFEGVDEIRVNLPATDPLNFNPDNRFSVALWVSSAGAPNGARVFQKNSNGDYMIHYTTGSGGQLCGSIRSSGGTRHQACANFPANSQGRLYHVALTYDGAALRLYFDGLQVAVRDTTLRVGNTGTRGLSLGSGFGANRWRGILDEISFYDRALSPEEVRARYTRGAVRYAFQVRWGGSVEELAARPFIGPTGPDSFFNPTEFPTLQAPVVFPTPGVNGVFFQFKGYFYSDPLNTQVIIRGVLPLLMGG